MTNRLKSYDKVAAFIEQRTGVTIHHGDIHYDLSTVFAALENDPALVNEVMGMFDEDIYAEAASFADYLQLPYNNEALCEFVQQLIEETVNLLTY